MMAHVTVPHTDTLAAVRTSSVGTHQVVPAALARMTSRMTLSA